MIYNKELNIIIDQDMIVYYYFVFIPKIGKTIMSIDI